jgi:hypothetical protein
MSDNDAAETTIETPGGTEVTESAPDPAPEVETTVETPGGTEVTETPAVDGGTTEG